MTNEKHKITQERIPNDLEKPIHRRELSGPLKNSLQFQEIMK